MLGSTGFGNSDSWTHRSRLGKLTRRIAATDRTHVLTPPEVSRTVQAAVSALQALDAQPGSPAWIRAADQDVLPSLLTDPDGFLSCVRHDPQLGGVVLEALSGTCAKPREAAVLALRALACEVLDPDGAWSE